jgi:glycosyltransferase involved in cell wall biosynthesis
VTVNSHSIENELIRAGILAKERILVVENGVDVERFHPGRPSTTRNEAATVGTVANLHSVKGVADLIHAARIVRRQIPHARFLVWGDGPLRAELQTLIRELGLDTAVELRGHTQRPEEALRLLDIFVLPSRSEGSSNALLEALATGIPVVATHVGGTPVIVEHGTSALLVPAADPQLMAAAIIQLLTDPGLARQLSRAGRERVVTKFSIAQMVSRIETLYDAMLLDRRQPQNSATVTAVGDSALGAGMGLGQ